MPADGRMSSDFYLLFDRWSTLGPEDGVTPTVP